MVPEPNADAPARPGIAAGPRPCLRRDRPLLRRDATTLQIGIGPTAVRLADTPAVRNALAALDPDVPCPRGDTSALIGAGAEVVAALQAGGHLDRAGPSPVDRAQSTVGVLATDANSRDRLTSLLAAAGLSEDSTDPDVWLVVTSGPTRRGLVDDLVRSSCPHLIVQGVDGGRLVGPFVVPGRTACLRCVDAHHSNRDPRHPLLIEQAAVAALRSPWVTDPITDLTALSWAVRDIAAYVVGARPLTWSTTLRLDAPSPGPWPAPDRHRRGDEDAGGEERSAGVLHTWHRHPYCGCAWDDLVALP